MKLAITENGVIDLSEDLKGLVQEDGLESAVLISLLTDRRAHDDDRLPDGEITPDQMPQDKRGWVGDSLGPVNEFIGSRLWLLKREKQTEETRRRAKEYCEEALQWMIDDGHAASIDVRVEWNGIGRLEFFVSMTLFDGSLYAQTVKSGDSNAV